MSTACELRDAGYMYDGSIMDAELTAESRRIKDLCFEYNHTMPSDLCRLSELKQQIIGKLGINICIGPNVTITCATHPLDAEIRRLDLEIDYPITIGDYVFIGANTCILSGVTIGSRVLIGAGSVVSRDIPDDVLAFGNPCHVKRPITAADKDKDKYLVPPKCCQR